LVPPGREISRSAGGRLACSGLFGTGHRCRRCPFRSAVRRAAVEADGGRGGEDGVLLRFEPEARDRKNDVASGAGAAVYDNR
jgi:hypothetical protein